MEVGIRELRNHLSRYLDQVREGDEIVVTDRGAAVARIVPVRGDRVLNQLIAEGIVSPPKRPRSWTPQPVDAGGTVSDLVAEHRR